MRLGLRCNAICHLFPISHPASHSPQGSKNGCRKKAKLREICQYCNKTSHASEDCPIKLAAEEGYGSEDAAISGSEDDEDDAEPESSSEPETARHQPASTSGALPARANSYSPEVQASSMCCCNLLSTG